MHYSVHRLWLGTERARADLAIILYVLVKPKWAKNSVLTEFFEELQSVRFDPAHESRIIKNKADCECNKHDCKASKNIP